MLRTLPAVLSLSLTLAASARGQAPAMDSYDTVFNQVKNLAPRGDRFATVHGLVLRRDVMELRLDAGALYVLTPVAGRTIGVAFAGAGSVSFVPPLEIERAHVRRVLGDSVVSGPITRAVLIFTDSTLAELERSLSFTATATAAGDAGGDVHDALEYMVDRGDRYVDPSLMSALMNGTTTGFFAAYIKRARGEGLMVEIDPTEAEEVLLLRRGRLLGQRVETVSQFQRAEDLRNHVAEKTEQPEPLVVDAYGIDATIDGNYKFSAKATVRLTARRDRHRWIPFLLYSELDVDSVADENGTPLPFFRADHTAPLWVRLEQPMGPGDVRAVRVAYHGNLIGFGSTLEQFLPPWWDPSRRDMPPAFDNWAFIKSTSTWYPRYSFEQSAAVDLTFHTPKAFKFASIGRLVDSRTEGNVVTTHWVAEMPTTQVSFNIGQFDEFEIKDPRIPRVTVQVNADAHRYINRYIPSPRKPEEQVGADVANSLAFFTQAFGPPLFERYYASEIPYFHGQAFPGMILLSWATFLNRSTSGADQSFRAHEMAHQWWGIGVEPAGSRDAWLSEGFAEFSGLWYMQTSLRDNDKYFRQLRESRDEIRRQRDRAVPIGLGVRAAESWSGNYTLVVYQKGAWVLHMLRNLMLDLRTMNEDAFKATMQDFYTTYRGKRASTEDFQRVVERHVGQPMDWFFREWVMGTGVPTYGFSWTADPKPDGTYALRLRVRQTDVPDDFVMPVPLLIRFADGEAYVRLTVKGPLTEVTLTVPGQPRRVELNAFESVLADVKTLDWRP